MELTDSTLIDDDEVLMGPITKREIIHRFKCHTLLNPELLEPLDSYGMDDPLDEKLVMFYGNILESDSDSLEPLSNMLPEKMVTTEHDLDTSNTNNMDKSENDLKSASDIFSSTNNVQDSSSDLSLNDTLHEMEMLIKFGLSYMEDDYNKLKCDTNGKTENNSVGDIKKDTNEEIAATSELDIVSSKLSTATSSEKLTEKDQKNLLKIDSNDVKTPIKNMNIIDTPASKMSTSKKSKELTNPSKQIKDNSLDANNINDPEIKNAVQVQKVVSMPQILKSVNYVHNKPKPFTKPLSKKYKSPDVKNIKSPISIYINSSPSVPLIRNVFQVTHSVLPAKAYQPASSKLLMSNNDQLTLPGSIQKLMKGSASPQVMKHVARLKMDSEKTSEEDSASASLPNTSHSLASDISHSGPTSDDISILISKTAARTNTLNINHN